MRVMFVGVVALVIGAGCPAAVDVPCVEDSNCSHSSGGSCRLSPSGNRWCSYPDFSCPSGYRYSDRDVGDGLASECVAGGPRRRLEIKVSGNGTGLVSSSTASLTCSATECVGDFDDGTTVELTAAATTGAFLGWADGCRGNATCTVTMDRDRRLSALFGTPGSSLWVRQLGTADHDTGNGITVDHADNILVVGEFSRTIDPGGGPLTSAGATDIFVAKLSSATGATIWARRFGGGDDDSGLAVAVDEENNVYVSGTFLGTVDFGGGTFTNVGDPDAFVLKLSPDGDFRWARVFGGPGGQYATSIAASSNRVIVAGFHYGTTTVDTTTYPTVNGTPDLLVLGLKPDDGGTSWVRSFGGPDDDGAASVALDGAGNVVIAGRFRGTVNFGGSTLTSLSGSHDIVLLKLAGATGVHLSSKQIGGVGRDSATAIAVDASNSIFITGTFDRTAEFGCNAPLVSSQTTRSDVFLAKFSQASACLWAKAFGGTGGVDILPREGNAVTVNQAGDVAITGSFCGTISFGGATFSSASTCNFPDVFAARFAGSDGAHLNSIRAGGTGGERGAGVSQSSDGRFFVTGGFSGFAEFGGEALTSEGAGDAFVLGLAPL